MHLEHEYRKQATMLDWTFNAKLRHPFRHSFIHSCIISFIHSRKNSSRLPNTPYLYRTMAITGNVNVNTWWWREKNKQTNEQAKKKKEEKKTRIYTRASKMVVQLLVYLHIVTYWFFCLCCVMPHRMFVTSRTLRTFPFCETYILHIFQNSSSSSSSTSNSYALLFEFMCICMLRMYAYR